MEQGTPAAEDATPTAEDEDMCESTDAGEENADEKMMALTASPSRPSSTRTNAGHGVPGGMSLPADEAQSPKRPCAAPALEAERDEFLSLFLDEGEMDEEELHAAEEEEFIIMEAAADSGAGDNVASEADAPGYEVNGSAAPRRGSRFVGAGGHGMKNQGEMLLKMEAPIDDGRDQPIESMFQVADVVRPLFSVSRICDHGNNTMTFDKTKAVVRNPKGKVLMVFKRKGNLYIAQMKVRNPKHASFGRQGQ